MIVIAKKNGTNWHPKTFLLIGLVTVISAGCSKEDDSPTSGANLSPAQQVGQGWTYYEEGEYTKALQEFEGAIGRDASLSDAWNGKGWTLGKLPDRLDDAPVCFARALQIDTTRYDAIGGWAFAAYQLGSWSSAIQKSDSLLHRRPGWRFLHEATLNDDDVQLLKAAAHYNLGDFASSYSTVVNYLNPLFEADITKPAGRHELLDEIERLRRVNG